MPSQTQQFSAAYPLPEDVNREGRITPEAAWHGDAFISAIADSSRALIVLFDIACSRVVYANSYLQHVLGYSPQDVMGMSYRTLFRLAHPADMRPIVRLIEDCQVAHHGDRLSLEFRARHRSGEYRWLRANGTPFGPRNDRGLATQAVYVFEDITDRRRAEAALKNTTEELRRSEARLNAIISCAGTGLSEIASDGRFVRVNDHLCKLLGRSSEELLRLSVADVTHPQDLARSFVALKALHASPEPVSLDKRYIRGDGTLVWANSTLTRLEPDWERERTILAVTFDLTERKATEDALRKSQIELLRSQEELEQRVRDRTAELNDLNLALKDEIVHRRKAQAQRQELQAQLTSAQEEERRRISRELHDEAGQYLTGLLLGLNALKTPFANTAHAPRLEQLVSIAETLGRELHELASDIRPTSLDDLGLVETLENYLQQFSARTQINVEFHAGGLEGRRLPPAIESTLYRIVREALTNVVRHSKARRVSVLLEQKGELVSAIVEDDGVGFDPEVAKATGTARRLGLLGMRERAEIAGGELSIESAPGAGTTVFVRLPLAAERASGIDGVGSI